ncbi:MAG: hypothetical protein P1V97_30200, partial [Planctomycetota bacterium]|nr:hypothetical protein [Planctomycetota bacterium]
MPRIRKLSKKPPKPSHLSGQTQLVLQTLIRGFDRCNETHNGELLSQVQSKHIYQSAVILFLRLTFFQIAYQRESLSNSHTKS